GLNPGAKLCVVSPAERVLAWVHGRAGYLKIHARTGTHARGKEGSREGTKEHGKEGTFAPRNVPVKEGTFPRSFTGSFPRVPFPALSPLHTQSPPGWYIFRIN